MALSLAGGDPVPLAQSGIPGAALVPSEAEQVQWSPDGHWVAYVQRGPTYSTQNLVVVRTTGASPPRDLATCNGLGVFRFSWSPISNSIAYNRTPGTNWTAGQFMTVSPDGTHLTDLLKGRSLQYVWHF